ncbi:MULTISPECIES: glycosyltransferase 87 family protein [unclassified Nocardioides]|uniref:glycosyltransferase 87 family protein n=1 Tax=unclassified Nocardioides TaxID=2615069 RepID=UPI0009E6D2CB|nr:MULTISPECIES: glycosyltransferase 87 family protein [unclassified Nocardioides]
MRSIRGVPLVAALSLTVWLVVVLALVHPTFVDVRVYRAEGRALLDGLGLYGPLAGISSVNTYPPFAALVFVPTAWVSLASVEAASVVVNLVLLVVVSRLSLRLVGGPVTASAALLLAAVALWSEPVTTTLLYGQVNLALLALVLWDATRPAESRLRGIGFGLAAAIKVTPALLVVYLLLTGRLRAAAVATATFAATLAVSALVDANATWAYWTRHLFDVSRMGRLENSVNQSVRGWLVRAHHARDLPPLELLPVLLVLVAGLACAVLAHRRLGDAWGLPAAAVTGLLVSPISWSHHWVWCVPILALLWCQAGAWVLPTLLVFWSHAVWLVPHGDAVELHLTAPELMGSGCYVVFGIGFLALSLFQLRAVASARAVPLSVADPPRVERRVGADA